MCPRRAFYIYLFYDLFKKKNFPLLRAIKEANNEFLHKLEKTTSANANESISAVQFESKN